MTSLVLMGGAEGLPPGAAVIRNQGYGRGKIRKMLSQARISSCIPPRPPQEASPRPQEVVANGSRIETLFSRLRVLAVNYNPL